MSERERRIQRIAVGFAVVAVMVSVLAVFVVVARRDSRAGSPASRRVAVSDLMKLAPGAVIPGGPGGPGGDGVRVIDDALCKSLGLTRDDTIVAISGIRVTDAAQLHGRLRELGVLKPSSLFVDLVRGRVPALERWELDGDLEAAGRADPDARPPGLRGSSSAPWLDPLSATVVQLDTTTYELPLATFEAWLADPRQVMAGGVGGFTAGTREGLQVFAIRPGSVLGSLGIQNGDLIRAINGVELESTDQVIELIAKSTRRITVDVKRGGQMIILNYLIR